MVDIVEDMEEEDRHFATSSFSKDKVFASCSFSSLGLDSTLCEQLQGRLGFRFPTIVQARAIPVILSGRHVLVNASTGTGKTMAYLAPVIHQLQSYETRITRSDGIFALVLVPRRELCLQIFETLQKLLHRFHWIVPGYVMGGENRLKEKSRLRKGISILVATPGRLLDHLINTRSFTRDKLRWIIFDEADSILELGFRKEIEEILHILGARRDSEKPEAAHCKAQMLLLSATLNNQVNDLANISLDHPVTIGLSEIQTPENRSVWPIPNQRPEYLRNGSSPPSHEKYNVPVQLVQKYVQVCCGSRLVVLLSILKNFSEREGCEKTVVFFSTCNSVNFHHSLFSGLRLGNGVDKAGGLFLGSKILRLHGDMEQGDRTATFQAFKAENSAILLCTDVAARGLDFPRVKCIVQYDSPGEATEYVHRVGRTARLGESGTSLLFLQPVEMGYLEELKKHGVFPTEYEFGRALANSGGKPAYGSLASTPVLESYPLLGPLERAMWSLVEKEAEVKKQAKSAFRSWVRAYTAHRGELKRIFVVKKLHLGHVARSFVLKKEPSLGGGLSKKRKERGRRTMTVKRKKRR